ncbi:MAG: tRNA (adenosine(37)-N6)-dimethylallyltransferase MiaA [Thermodesulfobacteriota bacterium]|jgi:tRNA dimethylallyltransferase
MGLPQLVVITGPTATGKTALAVELAPRYNAEIVSADSRQVYRYLDIGTAKPTPAERAAVPHHLLDVVDPDEHFDSARFRTLALAAVQDITGRGKRVFVVGGTGLYLRALTRGLFAGPAADPELRARLYEQERREGRGVLHQWLYRVDPDAAARLHPHDTVRLVRALEVFLISGTPISRWQRAHNYGERQFSTLKIGLVTDRDTLARRIAQRCRQMITGGLVDEVRSVWERGYGPELPPLRTIGYAQIGAMLQGRCSLAEAVAEIGKETRRLAKRQLTWLRADPEVWWCPPAQTSAVAAAIDRFYERGADAD